MTERPPAEPQAQDDPAPGALRDGVADADAPDVAADAAPDDTPETPGAAPPPWRYEASARGPRAFVVLGLWWGALGLGIVAIDLALWIAIPLAAVTLPALWELIRGTKAWIEITPGGIGWGSGKREGFVARGEIDRLRFDTRLDFSLRLTIVTVGVSRIRLPYECIPRAARLKAALDAHGYPHEHHHFALLS